MSACHHGAGNERDRELAIIIAYSKGTQLELATGGFLYTWCNSSFVGVKDGPSMCTVPIFFTRWTEGADGCAKMRSVGIVAIIANKNEWKKSS